MKLVKSFLVAAALIVVSQSALAEQFCVSQKVVVYFSSNKFRAEILELYADNTAKVYYEDGSSGVVKLDQLHAPISQIGSVSTGQKVVVYFSSNKYRAEILELYADNTAKVYYEDGSSGVVRLDQIHAPINRIGNISAGQKVLVYFSSDKYRGEILELYADNTAKVYYEDGSSGVAKLAQIHAPITCVGTCQ